MVWEKEPLSELVVSLWNGTSGIKEHPKDSKEAIWHTEKALVASRFKAKSPYPDCRTDADLRTKSDLRAISSVYPTKKGKTIPTWMLRNPRSSVC